MTRGHCGSSSRDAKSLFHELYQLGRLKQRELFNLIDDSLQFIRHDESRSPAFVLASPMNPGLLFDWLRWWLHRRFTLTVFHSRPTDRSMTALNELRISNCEFRNLLSALRFFLRADLFRNDREIARYGL